MEVINLNETQNTRTLDQIKKASKSFDTEIDLPDSDAQMQGLSNLRNLMVDTSTSMETYRELLLRDVKAVKDAANAIQDVDSYLASLLHNDKKD